MFHNTHAFLASKIYKSEKDLLLVGSVLPDLAVTKIIPWDHGGLHSIDSAEKFYSFIKEKYPDFIDLAKGVIAHNIVDDFTHTNYIGGTGYAFQNNQRLVQLVKSHYGLEKERAVSKAHNFIESGVDIMLLKKNPKIQDQLKSALSKVDKEKLSEILVAYFGINKDDFLKSLTQFTKLLTKYDFSKEKSWIYFWRDLEMLVDLPDIGNKNRQMLVSSALKTVEDTYQKFIKYSLQKGSASIVVT